MSDSDTRIKQVPDDDQRLTLLCETVSSLLQQARSRVQTAVNTSMVYTYFEIGRMIVEEEQEGKERAGYGQQVLKGLSEYLMEEFGKGFSLTNLKQMRQFYLAFAEDSIGQTLSDQFKALPFSSTGRKFFLSWSHYLKLMRIHNADERHLRSFVLFDLKIGKLKHQDLGQMQMYVNYYDRKVRLPDENPTVGIILCKDKKEAEIEMTLPEDNAQIFASRYETVLPSKEALKKLLDETHVGIEG